MRPPRPAAEHALGAGARDHPRALEIHVEHAIPLALADLEQRAEPHAGAGAAGHVAHEVDGAERVVRACDGGVHLVPRRDVGTQRERPAPERLDLADDLVELVAAATP